MNADKVIQEVTGAVISVLAVLGTFMIVFFQLVHNEPVNIPDIATALIFAVISSYLTRVASVNGARQAGTAAAQSAITASRAASDAASAK